MADAAQDTTAVAEWMQETYTKKDFFDPYQENFTPLLSDLEECPDEPVKGKRWNVPLYMATAWNVRTGSEGGPQAEVEADSVVQGQVLAKEFKGTVKLTELLDRVGTSDAHFNGGALDHQMKQRTMEMTKLMQIHFWGIGTGAIGVVDDAVVAATPATVSLQLPWGYSKMRRNMRVDFYSSSTSTPISGNTGRKITRVNRNVRGITGGGADNTYLGQITVDSLGANLTAGDRIYLKGDYGYAPNGIEGLVADATIQDTFLGQSRTTYPDLNAVRKHNSGVLRPVSEDIMQDIADDIYFAGREIDAIRANAGVIRKIAQLSRDARRYNIVRGDYPKLIQGFREGDLLFAYDKVTATIKKDPNCPFRKIYFLSFRDSFYKHTSAEVGFLKRGGDILQPVVSSGGGGYDYSLQARLYAACNISNYFPPGNGVGEDIEDALAGD
jgi:hypothetical protein